MKYFRPRVFNLSEENNKSGYCSTGSSADGAWAPGVNCSTGGTQVDGAGCLPGNGNRSAPCAFGSGPGSSCDSGPSADNSNNCVSGGGP